LQAISFSSFSPYNNLTYDANPSVGERFRS
jgi:hypothetical protein